MPDCANHSPWVEPYTPDACHGLEDAGPFAETHDVASAASCVGGESGLYDMSGNVAEWEDACDANVGMSDECDLRGGDVRSTNASDLECKANRTAPRASMGSAVGFRCCAD